MAQSCRHGAVVRRYSAFFSASLLIAAITTTSALMRAAKTVVDLSDCTDADSECLRDAQRWVYDRFLRSLVRIDAAVFEAQASGACDALGERAASGTDELSGSGLSPIEVQPPLDPLWRCGRRNGQTSAAAVLEQV